MSLKALTIPLLATVLLAGCGSVDDLPPGYAIIYGVSDYATIGDLGQPHQDALAVAAMLRADGYRIISGDARINDMATMDNLLADFETARNLAEPDSRFLFYFAGHGFGDGMEDRYRFPELPQAWTDYLTEEAGNEPAGTGILSEVLLLHAADPYEDVPLAIAESVTDDALAALVAKVPSRQRIVVIDACHSGGFLGSGSSVDSVPQNYEGFDEGVSVFDALDAMTLYLEYDATDIRDIDERSAIVISAAGEQEFSYEGNWLGFDNGVFTHFFLQSPSQADHNYDGYVTASEAFAHASASIAAVANDKLYESGKFLPRVSGGAVDFILFRAE